MQSSGAIAVYSKSIRLIEEIGLPRMQKADWCYEICSIFIKNPTNCSTGVERWVIFEVLFHFRAGANNCSIKHHARHIRPPGIASRCVQAQPEGLHTLDAACWKVFIHEKSNIVEKRSHADGFLHKNDLFLEKLIILNSTTFDLW